MLLLLCRMIADSQLTGSNWLVKATYNDYSGCSVAVKKYNFDYNFDCSFCAL